MFTLFQARPLIAFALLAFLSQVLSANGDLMVGKVAAAEFSVDQSHLSMMSSDSEPSCHDKVTNSDKSRLEQHCCDTDNSCKADCNHCLVISVTASIFTINYWPEFNMPENILATSMPHFHSISISKDLKPPIA